MLILETTHICLVASKNMQGHKNLFEVVYVVKAWLQTGED